MSHSYTKMARFYDAIYAGKDYQAEAAQIRAIIAEYKRSEGHTLLDVACGTGKHLEHLDQHYTVEGLDISADLLEVARERLPGVTFYQADMVDFDLGRQYDAITCLFSAIGYVRAVERLNRAIASMASHLNPGGVLIVEPWFTPEQFRPGTLHSLVIEEPGLRIARMNVALVENGVSVLDMHFLVGTPEGVEHFTELHELALFTEADYLGAFEAAGLITIHDPNGLTGRGLYIGVRPTG